jgi:hypothetical protein
MPPKKKKKSLAAASAPAAANSLQETETFEPDTFDDPVDKNQQLADLLDGPWIKFAIVRIERIEINAKGWRAIHRT